MILYLNFNQVDLCHDCVCGPLIGDTKDILWMDDRVLIIIYEYLAMRSLKRYMLDTT